MVPKRRLRGKIPTCVAKNNRIAKRNLLEKNPRRLLPRTATGRTTITVVGKVTRMVRDVKEVDPRSVAMKIRTRGPGSSTTLRDLSSRL